MSDDLTRWTPIAREAITVSSSAVGFTAATADEGEANEAQLAVCQVQDAAIRYTVEGTTPTASLGYRADANTSIQVWGYDDIRNFQAIRETGTDAVLEVTYYRRR